MIVQYEKTIISQLNIALVTAKMTKRKIEYIELTSEEWYDLAAACSHELQYDAPTHTTMYHGVRVRKQK